jgi:hypothetical protein
MRDRDGDCLARGRLVVLTGEPSGKTRLDLERAIEPLGGRIDVAIDGAGIYAVVFPSADTLDELDELDAKLTRLGFSVGRSYVGELLWSS